MMLTAIQLYVYIQGGGGGEGQKTVKKKKPPGSTNPDKPRRVEICRIMSGPPAIT